MLVIGDISIDIEGAIEPSLRATTIEDPYYYYDPISHAETEDAEGSVAMMTIDVLPCELPRESSQSFGKQLSVYMPSLLTANLYTDSFSDLTLAEDLKRAVIVYRGELTEDYQYLNKYLNS
jgi:alpha-aminoadipic semialdehyde synthase